MLIINLAYAIIKPFAMMIKFRNAPIANFAMLALLRNMRFAVETVEL